MPAEKIHIYALSEDKGAISTWKALLGKMLRQLAPTHREDAIDYGPVGEPEGFVSYYKSRNPRDRAKKVTLKRAIATKLLQEGQNFVVVHLDGDTIWKEYRPASSLNELQFAALMRDTDWQQVVKGQDQLAKLLQGLDERLVVLVPCYSIEAWLYQNTEVAIELCNRHHQGRDVARFHHWQNNPGDLDEVDKPKRQTVLEGHHNDALATRNFPARKVAEVGKSFAHAIERLRACTPLQSALSK